MVAHGLLVAAVVYTLAHAPQIRDPLLSKRYAVHQVEFHLKDPAAQAAAGRRDQSPHGADAEKQAAGATEPWEIPQLEAALQTLVQPDLPPNLKLKEKIPIPAVAIWTPKKAPVKKVVPPRPQMPATAKTQPSLTEPNQELTLSDLSLAATDAPMTLNALLPGTTSPVIVEGPEPLQMAPAIPSESSNEPTPAAALSLSDLRMKEGMATLPPVNQTRPNPLQKIAAQGPIESDAGKGAGPGKEGAGSASDGGGSAAAKGAQTEAKSGSAAGITGESGAKGAAETDHLTFPKDGQYGVVVVGSSLEDEYPDLLRIWGGRIAYTVYLQVGPTKNWILQYSLPAEEAGATDSSAVLEAPWPYDVVRPRLIPALLNADSMVLHGWVNREGRFERLSLVYPPETPQKTLVLESLAQWKFRPAMQNGQPAAVEVVLVIPNEGE